VPPSQPSWAPVLSHDIAVDDRRARLADAQLYFIADATAVPGVLRAALAGGVDLFQLRDKTLGDDELLRVAATARELCARAGALFIVDDAPVAEARAAVGPERLVGLSTHTPAQVDAAAGVDLIGVGPVHATPTKEGRPAVGLDLVRHAAARATVPWFAIGGLHAGNLAPVLAAGARRVSVVRAIAEADDPERAARTLKAMLSLSEGGVGAARA